MVTPIEIVLSRLAKVRRSGSGFIAICPAHSDRTPSLSVKEGDDGRVLLHCFSGCEMVSVVAAMGLRPTDLFCKNKGVRRLPTISGVSLRELRAAAEFERQILYIVKSDQLSGRAVSQADWERAKLALRRISLARRVL